MSHPIRRERQPRLWSGYGIGRPVALLGAVAALWSAHCTFPEYDLRVEAASGSAGAITAGTGATAGQAGTAGTSLGGALEPGDGGAAGVGEVVPPECLPEQWPVNLCEAGCLRRAPPHCYDGELGDGELAVDCGGGECQPCTRETCVEAADCLSGTCEAEASGMVCDAPLVLTYDPDEQNPLVGLMVWLMVLRNDQDIGGRAFNIRELELRYYFDRNGAVEPLVVRATQSNLYLSTGGSLPLNATSWTVERFEDTDAATYNAYVAVRFGDSGQLFPGDFIRIYQQVATGDPASSTFDQRGNYSFVTTPLMDGVEWQRIGVFYQGELLWGLEPEPVNPRACFARGVNLNGPPLNGVVGQAWQGGAEAGVTTTGTGISQGSNPYPAPSGALATALGTSMRLQAGQELQLPTDNGEYLVYLYAISASNDASPSAFTVQGISHPNTNKFRPQPLETGYAWARLGPYRIEVTAGSLSVEVTTGAIQFAGIELWYPE